MNKKHLRFGAFSLIIFVSLINFPTDLFGQNAYITKRNNAVSVINLTTNTVIANIPCGLIPVAGVVSPDGLKTYITYQGDPDHLYSVISTNTNTITGNFALPVKSIGADDIDISPDGSKLYVPSISYSGDSVYVINTVDNAIIARIGLTTKGSVEGIAANYAGSKVYVAVKTSIVVIDAINNTVVNTINITGAKFLYGIAVSPDDTKVYTTDISNNMIYALNTTNNIITPIAVGTGNRPFGIAFSLNGAKVYAADNVKKAVYVIDANHDTITTTIPLSGTSSPYGLAITPDGSKLLVSNAANTSSYIYTISLANNMVTDSINVGSGSFLGKKFIGPRPGSLCSNSSTNLTSNIIGTNYQWQVSTDSLNFTNINDNAQYSGTSNLILQLNNVPSNWYGYQYRCMVNGLNGSPVSLRFENKWLGTYGSEWENNANWGCKTIADSNTNVIINQGNVILNSNTSIRSLKVNPGAVFSINPGFSLNISH